MNHSVSINDKINKLTMGDVLMPIMLEFINKNNSTSIDNWINKLTGPKVNSISLNLTVNLSLEKDTFWNHFNIQNIKLVKKSQNLDSTESVKQVRIMANIPTKPPCKDQIYQLKLI